MRFVRPPTIAILALLAAGTLTVFSAPPAATLNLKLTAPIKSWDEAVPLGNGTMGVLLWGNSNLLRLSLDRGDLWDERPSKRFTEVRDRFNWTTMQQLIASNRMDEFNDIFDSNYDYEGPPTKLPAGRVEIALDPSQHVESFELNLATAEALIHGRTNELARGFVNADDHQAPVALFKISGPPLQAVQLKSPDSVKKLGYPAPRTGAAEGLRWFEQPGADGFSYAICVGWKRVGASTLLAVTVATRKEGKSPQAVAQRRVEAALKTGYDRLLTKHVSWWQDFWAHSRVSLPDSEILQHYYLVRYFYGAASRRGAPPMPLQGVWTADTGSLPPWKGDYHNDLNTQMTYLAYRTSGDFDAGLCFLDYLWERLPGFRKFAADFYHAPGAAVPGVMSLAGQPLGGWGQYSLSPTMGAWNAHLFYLHWRQTGDDKFLRERAWPFCREIGVCLRALLKPDTNGVLVLPLSSSPEVYDNSRRAYLQPNSNYDIASMKMLFLALSEMADAVGDAPAARDWATAAKQLGEFHTASDGTLLLAADTPLPGSHRHLSNLIGLHPFNLTTTAGNDLDQKIIAASLKDWDAKGTGGWCGYSFAWMSCLRSRVGDAEAALRNLDIFVHAFILRNGFHANGDQTKSGFSGFTYRPFTLEGNFLAMEAVHEMLLQSWSPTPGQRDTEIVRIFPAMPWRWHDAAFEDLRAEGGWKVSARRENNATTWFKITATRSGTLRIQDNFDGREPQWKRSGVVRVGDHFEVTLRKGQVLEATLPKPVSLPPPPANLAEPVRPHNQSALPADQTTAQGWTPDNGNGTFTNPLMWGDWPDPDVIRVGTDFYFVSTSMHYVPGCPIAKSKDLVNWEMAGYAVPRFDEDPRYDLKGGDRYVSGSWASTIRYRDGIFYVGFCTPGEKEGRFSMCTAKDISGPWTLTIFPEYLYDPGLFFDDDGRVYVVHGQDTLYVTELNADALSVKSERKKIFQFNGYPYLEGAHAYKINGKYYVLATTGGTQGRQICLRADNIYGPYEHKVVLNDDSSYPGNGLHQGGMVQLENGDWWFIIMQDRGPIGRVPHLEPVTWVDGWPLLGRNGKGVVVSKKPDVGNPSPVLVPATSDEFSAPTLGLQWQWNHNPDPQLWSLTERPGYVRLKSGPAASLKQARNTLTQRVQGPGSEGVVELDVSGLKDGDVAGFGIFQFPYAYVAVQQDGGTRKLIMVNDRKTIATVADLPSETLWLKARASHIGFTATFAYSIDGKNFQPIGNTLHMGLGLPWTANRFALFNFNTKGSAGGHADFNYFHFNSSTPASAPTKP